MSSTVEPGLASVITQSGLTVEVIPPNIAGGVITNPASAADQGLPKAEPLYVNPLGPAALEANDTTFRLDPGQSWNVTPDQVSSTFANALTGGHRFTAIFWR